jgi:hypothetical protein
MSSAKASARLRICQAGCSCAPRDRGVVALPGEPVLEQELEPARRRRDVRPAAWRSSVMQGADQLGDLRHGDVGSRLRDRSFARDRLEQ